MLYNIKEHWKYTKQNKPDTKGHILSIPLHKMSRIEAESRLVLVTGCKKVKWRVTANGYGISFWGNKNVLKLDSSEPCKYTITTELHNF